MIWWIIYVLITAILVWILQTYIPREQYHDWADLIGNVMIAMAWPIWTIIGILLLILAAFGELQNE